MAVCKTYQRSCQAVRKLLTGAWLGKILAVTHVSRHAGLLNVYPQVSPQTLWPYAGRYISAPMGQCGNYLLELGWAAVDTIVGNGSGNGPRWVLLGVPTNASEDALALSWPT